MPAVTNITKVEVGYEAFTSTDEKIGITCSWDGGVTWATEYVSPNLGTSDPNSVIWVDFTNVTNWSSKKLSDANFLVKVRGVRVGEGRWAMFTLTGFP